MEHCARDEPRRVCSKKAGRAGLPPAAAAAAAGTAVALADDDAGLCTREPHEVKSVTRQRLWTSQATGLLRRRFLVVHIALMHSPACSAVLPARRTAEREAGQEGLKAQEENKRTRVKEFVESRFFCPLRDCRKLNSYRQISNFGIRRIHTAEL